MKNATGISRWTSANRNHSVHIMDAGALLCKKRFFSHETGPFDLTNVTCEKCKTVYEKTIKDMAKKKSGTDTTAERQVWVIHIGAGYGAFFFTGTEAEAEEKRVHKSNWEGGFGWKRLADEKEIAAKEASQCLNHPNYKWDKPKRFNCKCETCDPSGK